MVRCLVRRMVSAALLLVVGAGGGGLPMLDTLVFHDPDRLAEAFRAHYEASSSCHSDGCSIRSEAQPRILGDLPPQAPAVVAVEQLEPAPVGETVPSSTISVHYLSRAPPPSV